MVKAGRPRSSASARGAASASRAARGRRLEYAALALILVFGLALTFMFYKGMSNYGDDFAYTSFVPGILTGSYQENLNIFSLRPVLLYPLAASIAIFGYNDYGAGMYDTICYAIIIVLIYVWGRDLHSGRAGLIAALLFSFYPQNLEFNSAPSPMMPIVLMLMISAMLFWYGKRRSNPSYYWLSGVFTFLGALTDPLGYVYVIFFIVYVFGSYAKDSLHAHRLEIDYLKLFYFLGLATAVVFLGVINVYTSNNGNPFFELNLTNSYYSAAGGADQIYYTNPSLTYYVNAYFSYGFTSIITSALGMNGSLTPAAAASTIYNSIFNLYALNVGDYVLFPYFIVPLGLYLLYKRENKSYYVLVWAAIVVLYMEFGTMSLTHYFPIYKLPRFTAIVTVPYMFIMGIALTRFYDSWKGKWQRYARAGLVVALVVLLLVTSLPDDYWLYIYNHNGQEFMKVMAAYLQKAPNVTNIYAPALDPFYLDYYLKYPNVGISEYDNGSYAGLFLPNCSSVPPNTYLVIPTPTDINIINSEHLWSVNESWAFNPSECNFTEYANIYGNSTIAALNGSIVDRLFAGDLYYNP